MQFLAKGQGAIGKILAAAIISASLAGCGGTGIESGSSSGASATANATSMATVALSSEDYQAAPASSAIITVNRSGSSAGEATVGYNTVDGTAHAGTDYTSASGSLTWQDGDAGSKTVLVPVGSSAAGKNFSISLTSVSGQAN